MISGGGDAGLEALHLMLLRRRFRHIEADVELELRLKTRETSPLDRLEPNRAWLSKWSA